MQCTYSTITNVNLDSSTRVDIVWDVFQINRQKCGQRCAETRCSLCIDSKELEGFPIRVDENETELLSVL